MTASLLARSGAFALEAGWLEAMRTPMIMDCTRARRELDWRPDYDARQTLHELVAGYQG
jgi:nucleoside-diphosphate-sugar epimerase